MKSGSNWRSFGIKAALVSAVFLGFAPVFGKQAILFGFSSFAVVAFRTSLASALLMLSMLVLNRKSFYIYPAGLLGCLMAGGVNGVGSILYYAALARLDASIGHLLYSFYPIFVALWMVLDRQPVKPVTAFRLLFTLPAIYLLVAAGTKQVDLAGASMMIGSACLYALHLIINQRVLYDMPPATVTLYTLLSMTAVVVPVYLIFDRSLPAVLPVQASLFSLWWPILGMGVATFLSRLTLFMGVKHLGGMQTALLGLGELLVTIGLAYIWLHESLTSFQWVGAFLLGLDLMMIGVDKFAPERKRSTGILAFLNPPGLRW